MAWRHRRLLSAPSPAANETAACGGLCDPWCPSNCHFYYPSPPPPPLSPHTQPLPSPDDSSGGSHLSPTVVVVVALLGGIFLLVSYYVVIAKSCFGFRRRRSSRNNRPPRHPPPEDGDDFDPVGGHRMDHPIWYINTVGLNPVIVSAIAVFEYRKSEGLIDVGECTVCLSEFEEGETLRLLPKCSHAFHLSCIDTWLRSHTNCPLCRAPIVAPSSIGTGDRGALPGDRLTSQGSDGNSGDDREGNRAESSVRSGEIGRRTREETADGSGNGIESADGNGERSIKEAVEPTDANHHDLEAVEEIPPARRSVSMDACPYTGERESHESPPSDADCPSGDSWVGNSSASTLTGDTSEERRDQRASGVSAPRSLSWSGRFFTPRHNSHSSRSSNSVLPR